MDLRDRYGRQSMRRPSPLSLPLVAATLVGGLAVAWQLTVPEAPVMAALENDQDLAAGVRLVGPEGPWVAADDRETAPATAMTGPGPLAAARSEDPRLIEAARSDLTPTVGAAGTPAASIEAPLRLRTLATHLAPEAEIGRAHV